MMDKDIAESLKKRPEWKAFEKHVAEKIRDLDRVSNIHSASPDQLITETMGRIRALEIVRDIFEPFDITPTQKSDAQKKAEEKHGL
jgi:hypothetical protein